MSDIRLVRCPKCNKVLPEPYNVTVYRCGACGALLRSGESILGGGLSKGSEKLVDFDKGGEGEAGGLKEGSFDDQEGMFDVGRLKEGSFDDQEGMFDMGSRSPVMPRFGDGLGSKSPIKESHLKELNGYSPKSSVEDQFFSGRGSVLEDLDSSTRPRNTSRERALSDFDFDGNGKSTWNLTSASRSALRGEMGSRPPVSVRSRHFSSSPMRDMNGERTSPARPTNGDFRNSPMRGDIVSKFDKNVLCGEREVSVEQEATGRKVTSFTTWLPDGNSTGQSNVNYHGRRRTWRDRLGDGVDQISDSVHGSDYVVTPKGSSDDHIQGLKNDNVSGFRNSRGSIDQWVTGRHGVGVEHGLSDYRPDSMYGYDDERHNFNTLGGPASVQDLELERAELLRKYNDLKDQLSGLDIKSNSSSQSYQGADDYSEDESWRFKQDPLRKLAPDKTVQRHDPRPFRDMGVMYNYSPQYDDPFSGQLARQHQHKPHHQFLKRSIPGHTSGRSLDSDQDFFRSYNDGQSLDFDCDSLNSYCGETQYHHPAPNPRFERNVPRPYISRMSQTNPQERLSPLTHRHSRKTVVTTPNKRLCYPIFGGSPFVLCCKCFRLLKLPWKLLQKNHDRLQCGACAAIVSFDLQTKSFGLFLSQKKLDTVDSGSGSHEMTATSTNFGSYDFDAESSVISKGQRLSLSSADNLHHLSSSSSQKSGSSSKEDYNSYTSTEKLPLVNLARPPPGSTLKDHMQYSNVFRRHQAEGTDISDGVEKDILQKETSENAAIATKAEYYSHKASSTHDSKEDKAANSKDKHSSIASLVKRGFASRAGRPSPGKAEVYVNGQPISHRMVKRAEKISGPIEPGEYWYDWKAGFWGVMGHQCLGIIPSSIQEFNFPMPRNCSGGDTTIYVNGRELHKRDMDLLSSRGLPMTSNESYVIDISGKVVEEETREFVVNLGKLAPSIEKKRCGYGMQVPEKFED